VAFGGALDVESRAPVASCCLKTTTPTLCSPFPCRVFDGSIALVDSQDERSKELFGTGELLGLPLSEPASADRAEEIQALGWALAEHQRASDYQEAVGGAQRTKLLEVAGRHHRVVSA
jgi:hypothetical protein